MVNVSNDNFLVVKHSTKQSMAYAKVVYYESAEDLLENILILNIIDSDFSMMTYFEPAGDEVVTELQFYNRRIRINPMYSGIIGAILCAKNSNLEATIKYLSTFDYCGEIYFNSQSELDSYLETADARAIKKIVIFNSESRSVESKGHKCVSEFIHSVLVRVGYTNFVNICKCLSKFSLDSHLNFCYSVGLACESVGIQVDDSITYAIEARLVYKSLCDKQEFPSMNSNVQFLIDKFLKEEQRNANRGVNQTV